jgi:hypothetical protein
MLWRLASSNTETAYIMPKLAPTSYSEQQTTGNLDQALSGMLDAMRKPLKLTATLKRRALKRKGRKSELVDPGRQLEP